MSLRGTYVGARAACPRAWEASAIEDGRLGPEGRVAFERHATGCADCKTEVAELSALRRYADADVRPEAPPLERRRLRAELLRRANEDAMAPRARGRAPLLGALAAAAIVALFVLARRPGVGPAAPMSLATAATAHYEVRGQGAAQWHATQDGGTTRVSLVDGEASFHVEHLAPGERFLVALPDGEVEVRGTRFVVAVERGRTRRVQVTEGRVALRVRDARERELYAGEAWEQTTTSPPPSVSATASAPATSQAVATAPATERAPLPTAAPPAGSTPSAPSAPAATVSARPAPTASASGARFHDAMAHFRAARYAEAEGAFAEFEATSPADPRAEDAAWLGAVSRSRAGDAAGAARLAQRYLDRYPQGLRRAEAEALVKGGKP